MTDSTIKTLRSQWDKICDGVLPPFRSDISPRAMPDVLDTLFILEQINPEDTRIRIAGLKICEMMGMEVRGQSPMSFFDAEFRDQFETIVTDVLGQPNVTTLRLETVDKMGNIGVAEMNLLPLRSDFGDISRIIGCITVPETGFIAPIRYKILDVKIEVPFREIAKRDQGFAEATSGFSMSGAPNLRTVEGNLAVKPRKVAEKPSWLKLVD